MYARVVLTSPADTLAPTPIFAHSYASYPIGLRPAPLWVRGSYRECI